jgi:trk system potassium uptake protein TrkA
MKQYAVLGLGKFGFYLAQRLQEKGNEVLAIDRNAALVQEVSDVLSHVVVGDSTDKDVLASLGVAEMDAAIVCIGSDVGSSILTTLNLLELKVKDILAKAVTEAHGRALARLGVREVFIPERDIAVRLAERLNNSNLLEYVPLIQGYNILEWVVPEKFGGKTLRQLDLSNKYGAQVLAIKALQDKGSYTHIIPKGDYVLRTRDHLILMAPEGFTGEM